MNYQQGTEMKKSVSVGINEISYNEFLKTFFKYLIISNLKVFGDQLAIKNSWAVTENYFSSMYLRICVNPVIKQ